MIHRTIHPEIPSHTDYALTDRGRALPVLGGLIAWSVTHIYTAPDAAAGAA